MVTWTDTTVCCVRTEGKQHEKILGQGLLVFTANIDSEQMGKWTVNYRTQKS